MTTPRPRIRAASLTLAALAAWLLTASPAPAFQQAEDSRQVVIFAVKATPGSTEMDEKISKVVQARLRKTLPGHGFKLIKIKSERVTTGQSVALDLENGFVTSAQLTNPLDGNGKVQMRFDLSLMGTTELQSIVTTPPDQFNFFDKMLPDNSHLLIGVGAR